MVLVLAGRIFHPLIHEQTLAVDIFVVLGDVHAILADLHERFAAAPRSKTAGLAVDLVMALAAAF